jgi:poly(3-hydroxyalkanoate) synthetase
MKNLICFTTPIDFREMKLFQNFSDRRYFDVDHLVDSIGNVPPEMILSSFEMLRPASRAASQSRAAAPWHLGQWRLRQELYAIRRWLQSWQRST